MEVKSDASSAEPQKEVPENGALTNLPVVLTSEFKKPAEISKSDASTRDFKPPELTVGKIVGDLLGESHSRFYNIPPSCPTVTEEFDPKTLLNEYKGLTWGTPLPRDPESRALETNKRLKEYIGDISDEQFDALKDYCSEDHLRMPHDLKISNVLTRERPDKYFHSKDAKDIPSEDKLTTTRRVRKRMERDPKYIYKRILKYRGDKISLQRNVEKAVTGPVDLEPGKELLFRVRIYRPFVNIRPNEVKMSNSSKWGRGPLFQQDMIFLGQQLLEELLDRISCANDFGPRTDCSVDPDAEFGDTVKDDFPSGLLFINNVFYVDTRHPRGVDYSAPVRAWARRLGLGEFPARSVEGVRFQDLTLRLGHPELYMHQGNCEHCFTFSEVSVLQSSGYCASSVYPHRTAMNATNAIYCAVCTNYVSRWIVVGCERIPFDPAYVCDVCFKQYNYVDGKKVGDFKVYRCFDKNT